MPGFQEQSNRSTPFYLWQNDPALIRASNAEATGVTPFCIPATLTNLLARARVLHPESSGKIPLQGLSDDGTRLEGSAAVLGFMGSCGIAPSSPIDPLHAADCVRQHLLRGGLSGERVRLIRRLGARESSPGLRYEDRAPALADLIEAVHSGDEVALTLAFMVWDGNQKIWKKSGSHMVNVTGFARNPGEDSLLLHISNPTRKYRMDGSNPVYDTIRVSPAPPSVPLPAPYSSLQITTVQGRLIEFEGKTTFVGGLIRVRTQH
jgi:hypothetical protein